MPDLCSHISCSNVGTQCNTSKIDDGPCGAIDKSSCENIDGHYCEIKPVINLNKSHLNFINKSNKKLYLIFDKDPKNDAVNWKMSFDDNNYIDLQVLPISNSQYKKIEIPESTTLYLKDFNASSTNKPNWIAGAVRASFEEPTYGLDLKGMTVMEWTFKNNASAGIDISSVDGVNISARLNIIKHTDDNNFTLVNESTCDDNSKSLIFDINNCDNFKIEKNGIKRCINPTYNENFTFTSQYNDITSNSNINCGIHNNCGQCGTGADKCPPGSEDTNICFAENFNDRLGCHIFWETDPTALEWKNLINNGDVYSWAYDELRLQNYDSSKNLDHNLIESWPNNKWYDCFKKNYNEDPSCNNYLVRNNKSPLISCSNFDVNTTAVFTICQADGSSCNFDFIPPIPIEPAQTTPTQTTPTQTTPAQTTPAQTTPTQTTLIQTTIKASERIISKKYIFIIVSMYYAFNKISSKYFTNKNFNLVVKLFYSLFFIYFNFDTNIIINFIIKTILLNIYTFLDFIILLIKKLYYKLTK